MKSRNKHKVSVVLGLLIILWAIVWYFRENKFWYFVAPFGAFLLFDYLSHLRGNKTTLDILFEKKYSNFIKLYLILFVFGIFIEVVGSYTLGLWSYKLSNYNSQFSYCLELTIKNPRLFLGWVGYPIILMHFKEIYSFIGSFFRSKPITVIISMILGILIWEIPNNRTLDWIYKIPFVNFEVLGINIIVIVGWGILILVPLWIYRHLGINDF